MLYTIVLIATISEIRLEGDTAESTKGCYLLLLHLQDTHVQQRYCLLDRNLIARERKKPHLRYLTAVEELKTRICGIRIYVYETLVFGSSGSFWSAQAQGDRSIGTVRRRARQVRRVVGEPTRPIAVPSGPCIRSHDGRSVASCGCTRSS